MKYLKIKVKQQVLETKKTNIIFTFFIKLLKLILPKANPDFDDIIDDVSYWYVEFNKNTLLPNREIGFNNVNQVILKMPHKDNYGYWTDNNLKLEDFITSFEHETIDSKLFNQKWNSFSL